MFHQILRQLARFSAIAVVFGIVMAPSCLAQDVSVTITSNYTPQAFTVSGSGCAPGGYSTPQTLQWTPGSSCTVTFVSPYSLQLGTQYVFSSWQDGNTSNPRVIATPTQATTYTATFTQQYFVSTQANPPQGGSVSGGGWVNSYSYVTLTATPASGYSFLDWNGVSVSPPTTNPATVQVYGPTTATADFALNNALPGNYTLTQVTSFGSGAGINSYGQVAGSAGFSKPFLWTPASANAVVGSLTDLVGLPVGGSPYSNATGINDQGQVVGWTNSGSQTQVFLWSPTTANSTAGSILSLAGPSSQGSSTTVINNFGQVGGYLVGNWGIWTPSVPNGSTGTITTNSQFQSLMKMNSFGQAVMQAYPAALLFTPSAANGATGTFTSITGLAGSQGDVPQGINDKGVIVGSSCMGQPMSCQNHGFIWTPTTPNGASGTAVEIPLPTGFVSMTPTALNNQGDVVGTMVQSGGSTIPFLYTGGKMYELIWISGLLTGATPVGINQAGQIVLNANSGVYLASPMVPIPASVPITINSAPAGLSFVSEGSSYTTPYTFQWTPESSHNVSFANTVTGTGTRLGFAGWADGVTTATRSILVPTSPATFTANYVFQYQLSLQVNPVIGGIIMASPNSADGFYNAGTNVQITAMANSAYQFTGYSGDLTGSTPTQRLVMSTTRNVTANFAPVLNPALTVAIVNDVSKAAQPGTNVTAAIRLTNSGPGAAKNIQLTAISARVLAPVPGVAPVNKTLPVAVGDLPAGTTSGTVYIPVVLPSNAQRVVMLFTGTVMNSAGRLFTFNTSITMIR